MMPMRPTHSHRGSDRRRRAVLQRFPAVRGAAIFALAFGLLASLVVAPPASADPPTWTTGVGPLNQAFLWTACADTPAGTDCAAIGGIPTHVVFSRDGGLHWAAGNLPASVQELFSISCVSVGGAADCAAVGS